MKVGVIIVYPLGWPPIIIPIQQIHSRHINVMGYFVQWPGQDSPLRRILSKQDRWKLEKIFNPNNSNSWFDSQDQVNKRLILKYYYRELNHYSYNWNLFISYSNYHLRVTCMNKSVRLGIFVSISTILLTMKLFYVIAYWQYSDQLAGNSSLNMFLKQPFGNGIVSLYLINNHFQKAI